MTMTAVVTGAGRGLGRLIAERLARKGHAVLCTDIDAAAAADTAQQIAGGAWSAAQDVRDAASHRTIAAAAAARGALRVWINNAGVLAVGAAWEHGEAEVRRLVEINLLGVMWGANAAVGAMRERGGTIVNIGSMSSVVAAPGVAVYSATKHAVLGYTIALQGDLDRAHLPIRCAVVCPDAMETDMLKGVAHQDASNLLFSAGRLLRADAVADEVVALTEHPHLVRLLPRGRGALAHLVRPFPQLGLRLLDRFAAAGRKVRHRRGLDRVSSS